MLVLLFVALPVLIIDQLSKFIALKNIPPESSLTIIRNVFHLTLVYNKGVAFGIFSQQAFGPIFLAYICVIAIILFSFKQFLRVRKSTQIYLSLILAGAVGNLIDRIRFGFVIDFLDFRIWPVFNVADSAITIGTILLLLRLLKKQRL